MSCACSEKSGTHNEERNICNHFFKELVQLIHKKSLFMYKFELCMCIYLRFNSLPGVAGSELNREVKSEDCIVCVEGEGGRCRVNGVTYKLTCKGCGEVYIGQSSKNAYTRGKEHVSTVNPGRTAPRAPSQAQPLQSQPSQSQPSQASSQTYGSRKPRPKPTLKHHVDEKHAAEAEPIKFKMEVTEVFGGDALMRQISEAIQIRETGGQMNRQEE